jgi:hypothetical protein
MQVNYDEVQRFLAFKSKVNGVDLADIEWVRDNGEKITVDRRLTEAWRFMGMTNISFVEDFLERIVAGETEALLQEMRNVGLLAGIIAFETIKEPTCE